MGFVAKDVFVEDAFGQADAALVIGAPDVVDLQQRIAAGIALVKSRRVPLLILSGGGRKEPGGLTEAERMCEVAVAAGLREDILISDSASTDLAGIAKEFQRLLKADSRLSTLRSLAVVSSAWHLLRASIVFRKHVPRQVKLYCHPTPDGITARNWMLEPRGRAAAENELRLIEKLLKSGYSAK
jgi:vancomycin permeability regulator SanA